MLARLEGEGEEEQEEQVQVEILEENSEVEKALKDMIAR